MVCFTQIARTVNCTVNCKRQQHSTKSLSLSNYINVQHEKGSERNNKNVSKARVRKEGWNLVDFLHASGVFLGAFERGKVIDDGGLLDGGRFLVILIDA